MNDSGQLQTTDLPALAASARDAVDTLAAILAPLLTQQVRDAVGSDLQRALREHRTDLLLTAATQTASALDAHRAELTASFAAEQGALTDDATRMLRAARHASRAQLIMTASVVAVLLGVGVAIVIAALCGNHQASDWILAAPTSFGAAALWISRAYMELHQPYPWASTPLPGAYAGPLSAVEPAVHATSQAGQP